LKLFTGKNQLTTGIVRSAYYLLDKRALSSGNLLHYLGGNEGGKLEGEVALNAIIGHLVNCEK
jgi:hypothetical protein